MFKIIASKGFPIASVQSDWPLIVMFIEQVQHLQFYHPMAPFQIYTNCKVAASTSPDSSFTYRNLEIGCSQTSLP